MSLYRSMTVKMSCDSKMLMYSGNKVVKVRRTFKKCNYFI